MTDSRLPGSWLTDKRMDDLTDRAWRTFTGSLMYSNEAGTDGHVPQRQLRFIYPDGVDATTRAALVRAGIWIDHPSGDGIAVHNWEGMGQSLAETVEARKRSNRERVKAHRAKKGPRSQVVTGDVTPDVTRYVGEEQVQMKGQEQALDAHAKNRTEDRELESPRTLDWPVVPIPSQARVAS